MNRTDKPQGTDKPQVQGEGDYEAARRYRKEVNPKAVLYSVDLAGYGTLQFPQGDQGVVQLAGWSDRVLDLISAYEDRQGVVDVLKDKF